jgi:microcystin-dependent protein
LDHLYLWYLSTQKLVIHKKKIMDDYLAEIRGFAGSYNPMSWQICAGQLLNISSNTALYSLLGITFGGDGRNTFALPDLRGRAPIGTGTGVGLTPRAMGVPAGLEKGTLTQATMPMHNHTATPSGMTVTGTATGNVTPKCCEEGGDNSNAVGNALASITNGYVSASDATGNMAPIPASLTLNGTVSGTVTVGNNGASAPVSILQPVLAINWIICVSGLYPNRP